ncbi:MAG: ABC transporter permease [Acidimicrobiia bacterium]
MRGRRNPLGVIVLLAIPALWELAIRSGAIGVRFLPAPTAVLGAARDVVLGGELVQHVAHTVVVTLVGWLVASSIGVFLGLALGLSETAHRFSMTSFEVTRAIPPITFAPAALLVFGFSLRMGLVLVIYVGIWPVLVNTIGGVRSVAPELRDLARMLRLSHQETIRKVVLPAAMPSIVVGLRLALSMCLILAIVAEMVGNPAGVGNALIRASQALQPETMFVYVITAGLLGVGLNAAFGAAARAVLPQGPSPGGSPW